MNPHKSLFCAMLGIPALEKKVGGYLELDDSQDSLVIKPQKQTKHLAGDS